MKLPFPLQTAEQVVLVTKRHWIFFVPRFLLLALAAVVPVAVLLYILSATGHFSATPLKVGIGVSAVWLLFWIARLAMLQYRYDHDLWVVTDRRVVDVVKRNPFDFNMSAADLVEIEDVSTNISGMLQSLFDYGNLECQTAGAVRHFTFRGVPNPRQIAAVVEQESLAAKGQGPKRAPLTDRPTERL